jgi:hypothetical protein
MKSARGFPETSAFSNLKFLLWHKNPGTVFEFGKNPGFGSIRLPLRKLSQRAETISGMDSKI